MKEICVYIFVFFSPVFLSKPCLKDIICLLVSLSLSPSVWMVCLSSASCVFVPSVIFPVVSWRRGRHLEVALHPRSSHVITIYYFFSPSLCWGIAPPEVPCSAQYKHEMTFNCGRTLWFCPTTKEEYCPTSLCNLKCLCVHEMLLCFVKCCIFRNVVSFPKMLSFFFFYFNKILWCFVERLSFSQMLGSPKMSSLPKCRFVPWNVLAFSRKLLCSLKHLVLFNVIEFREMWGFVQWRCVLGFFFIKLSEMLCFVKCRHVSQILPWYIVV